LSKAKSLLLKHYQCHTHSRPFFHLFLIPVTLQLDLRITLSTTIILFSPLPQFLHRLLREIGQRQGSNRSVENKTSDFVRRNLGLSGRKRGREINVESRASFLHRPSDQSCSTFIADFRRKIIGWMSSMQNVTIIIWERIAEQSTIIEPSNRDICYSSALSLCFRGLFEFNSKVFRHHRDPYQIEPK
jgi:hypothetical protein